MLGQTDDAIEGVVKAAPVSADAAPTDSPNFKHRTLPVVNLSDDEVEAYEKNPNHKPKLDYKPKGKKSQPSKHCVVRASFLTVCSCDTERNRLHSIINHF